MEQTVGQLIKWDFKANPFLAIKDTNGNLVYFESSGGYWEKRECNSKGKEIYYENSNGVIEDNRPKQCLDKEKDLLEERCKYVLKYLFRDYENTMTAKQYNNAMLALRSIALGNPLLKNQ